MKPNAEPTLRENLRANVGFLATYRMKASPYFRLGLIACALRLVIYVLTQTMFLIGSATYTKLSLGSDLLVLAVALLTMLRARDVGMRGWHGFFIVIVMVYGLAICLYSWMESDRVLSQVAIVRTVAIAPLISQAIIVWLFSQLPSNLHRRSMELAERGHRTDR